MTSDGKKPDVKLGEGLSSSESRRCNSLLSFLLVQYPLGFWIKEKWANVCIFAFLLLG